MSPHDQISTPEGVVSFAKEWIGVDVGVRDAALWSLEARLHKGPFAWLKGRILERGPIEPVSAEDDESTIVTATLHVGFLCLPGTSEMLERLSFDPEQPRDSVARSKMFDAVQRIEVSPIDATAGRVAGCRRSS